jgi:stearoyl-CoA desaturase (delta-9 desaturase)
MGRQLSALYVRFFVAKYFMIAILYTLIATHITIICVTLFLHRGQAHRGIQFHPILSHFMRFWLWLTTGMITKEWVAIHRKHHRFCENKDDPHSPKIYGLPKVLFMGAFLYAKASKDKDMVNTYGVGTPDDFIERKLYTPCSGLGILILLVLNVLLFGWWGFLVWGIQMIWIPFWAAGVINGIGHYWGYRNGDTRDNSRNIVPWGIIIGGEELHNNHHLNPAKVKLSNRKFEFDIGYMYLKLFQKLRLATVS